jgi:hypothetical protein
MPPGENAPLGGNQAVTHDTQTGATIRWLPVANRFRCRQILSAQFRLAIEPFTHHGECTVPVEAERLH